MKTYQVAEFRKGIRLALNIADAGEDVYIIRHDKAYKIIPTGAAINLPIGKIIKESTPKGKNEFTPHPSQGEFIEAGAQLKVEKPCCKKAKPCQHWDFDANTAEWVNTLSGRKREVES